IGNRTTSATGANIRRGSFRITPQLRLLDTTAYTLSINYRANRYQQGADKPFLLNGNRYTEELMLEFTTGETVKMIGPEAVTKAYPESMMYNTYRDQRTKVCFAEIGDTEQLLGAGWIDPNTQELVMYYLDNVSRDTLEKVPASLDQTLLTWPELPSSLGLDKTYELQLRIAPKGTVVNGGTLNLAVPARAMDPRPTAPFANGHLVYQNWFRTSMYATFAEKVSNLGWAETQQIERTGTLTPTYGTDSVKTNYGVWSDHPYVENSTVRSLGFAGYREAVGLREPFADIEVGGIVGIEIQSSAYITDLVDNYFNFAQKIDIPSCVAAGNLGGQSFWVKDQLDISQIYLRQGVQAPSLTKRSGHREGENALLSNPNTPILDDPSQAAVTIAEMQAADIAPRPPVNYTSGQTTLAAPLVLVNNLHPASIAQYNYSWAFRSGKRLPPCDVSIASDNPDLEGELDNTPNPGELADIIDEVNDAILGSIIAEGLGFGPSGNPLEGGTVNPGGGLDPSGTPAGTPNTLPDL
ncbi:MAG: hypothetical protein AAF840_15580, partial [Bacteroidota bacterium]